MTGGQKLAALIVLIIFASFSFDTYLRKSAEIQIEKAKAAQSCENES